MRILLATLIVATALSPAFASSDSDDSRKCGATDKASWMSVADISAKAEAMGLKVRSVKTEDGCYEVYAIDAKGQRIEAYMHPVTGEVVRQKVDD
ncbi:MAG TPA: PepSY domain-containing protein [Rhizobiaceae bacterium]|nr:PepSY domain-containing protein [Rhizobiaceae bacterium]